MYTNYNHNHTMNDAKKRPKRCVDDVSLGPRYVLLFLFLFLLFYCWFFINRLQTSSTATITITINCHPNNDKWGEKWPKRCIIDTSLGPRYVFFFVFILLFLFFYYWFIINRLWTINTATTIAMNGHPNYNERGEKRPKRSWWPRYVSFLFIYYRFFIRLWTTSIATDTITTNGYPKVPDNDNDNDNDETGLRRSLRPLVQRREKGRVAGSEGMTTGLETCMRFEPLVCSFCFIS